MNATEQIAVAPGRVNLIGDHTDYNDGFVLPFALPQRTAVAAAPRTDDIFRIHSDGFEPVTVVASELTPGMTGWAAYAAGVVWALRVAGFRVTGTDLYLSSTVPVGAGLSSSAAVECATLAALAELNGIELSGLESVSLARRAENEYVGAPTGIMDQAASTLCRAGHALFLDCRSLETRQVPFDLAGRGFELLVLDTNTPHTHVDGEYAARRADCERAARILGVPALRDVVPEGLDAALAALPDGTIRQRVRHVVTENQRVLDAVTALRAGDLAALAALLDESHASMRDDYQITVPTVDLAVETARTAGAIGARMTGGGFGGCIIALCAAGAGEAVGSAVADAFAAAGHAMPTRFIAHPADGARRIA